jgi:hypothetical protein
MFDLPWMSSRAYYPPHPVTFISTNFKPHVNVNIRNIKMTPIYILALITPKPDRVARVSSNFNPL